MLCSKSPTPGSSAIPSLASISKSFSGAAIPAFCHEETRAARGPSEMDAEDLARLMNTSRYSGKAFTADDYNRLRTGLGGYKATRGLESK